MKQVEKNLRKRLVSEAALVSVSGLLLRQVVASDSETLLDEALLILLKASEAERAHLFKNVEDPELGLCLKITHGVGAEGVWLSPDNPAHGRRPYQGLFDEWVEAFSKGGDCSGGRGGF